MFFPNESGYRINYNFLKGSKITNCSDLTVSERSVKTGHGIK